MNQIIKHVRSLSNTAIIVSFLCVGLLVVFVAQGLTMEEGFLLSAMAFGLGNVILETNSTDKKPDVSTTLTFLRPDIFPLDTVLRRMDARRGAARAKAQKIEWRELDVLPYTDAKNGASTAGGAGASVNIVVDNGAYWKPEDVAYLPNETGGSNKLLVTAVSGNTLTVYAIGDTAFGTVPAIADNDPIIRMMNAKEEYNDASEAKSVFKASVFNYTQIFDAVLAISETRLATEDYTLHDYDANQKQHLFDLRRSMELAALFGRRSIIADPTSSRNRTMMGGLANFISTNDITYTTGAVTESLLIDWAKQIFTGNSGSRTRLFFSTPAQTAEIDKVLIASGTLQSTRGEKVLGVEATKIHTSFGNLMLIPHQGMEEYGKTNYGLVVDPAQVRRRPLRPMKIKRVENNDKDGRSRQWIEEFSIEWRYEKAHAVVRDSATDTVN